MLSSTVRLSAIQGEQKAQDPVISLGFYSLGFETSDKPYILALGFFFNFQNSVSGMTFSSNIPLFNET